MDSVEKTLNFPMTHLQHNFLNALRQYIETNKVSNK